MHSIVADVRMISFSGIGRYLSSILPFFLGSSNYRISLLGFERDLARFSFLKEFHFIPVTAPIYSLNEQLQYVRIVKNCDLFWSPHFNVPLLPIRAKYKVVTIHDVFHLAYASQFSFLQRSYARMLIAKAVNSSDQIITISKFSKSEILKYTRADDCNISVIHNGIDTCYFQNMGRSSCLCLRGDYSSLSGRFFVCR